MSGLKGEKLYVYLIGNVEDELSEDMKAAKEKAFKGEAEAQYRIGMYYFKNRDPDIMAVGIRFLAEAAKRGHEGARTRFMEDGEDWRDYC